MPESLPNFKADFYKALAHPVRIRILELLRSGELSVSELQERLDIDSSGVSQQLSILRNKSIVASRRSGTTVYYRVPDPDIFELLDVTRRIFNNHLVKSRSTLEQMEEENTQELDQKSS
jgi:DNA-binding transcriptional ArsR family regulator